MEDEAEERRRWWRDEWLTRVQEMADLDTQRATWLNPRPRTWNPHYSYIEYATTYLDRADWPNRVSEGLLSDDEAEVVAALDDMVRSYSTPTDDFDHAAILSDPHWLEIIRAARKTQERLASMIVDAEERSALLTPSEHALEAAQQVPEPQPKVR